MSGLFALAPLEAEDILKLKVSRVHSEKVDILSSKRRDPHLSVDIEKALFAARAPDGRSNTKLVAFEVIVFIRTDKVRFKRSLDSRRVSIT